MERLKQKLDSMHLALESLHKAVIAFNKRIDEGIDRHTEDMLMVQDSLIQRFKYNTDLLWKVLKVYLQDVEKIHVEANSPRGIVRASVMAKFLSEQEGEAIMNMVDFRNQTSHIYHEEIAAHIADHVPDFYVLIKSIVDRLSQKISTQ